MTRVVVLAGGRSSEREVSLASGESVLAGLREGGHDARLIEIDREGRWLLEGGPVSVSPGQGLDGFDVAFPVVHGPWGEDGSLQGMLEAIRIPYVGSGVHASSLCIDKVLAKERMAQAGIPQVGFVAVTKEAWEQEGDRIRADVAELGFPVWVKPARLGSSVGISRVDDSDALAPAIRAALGHDPRVIVEQSSPGREIEVSVLELPSSSGSGLVTSPPGEITLPGAAEGEWYDYERKYTVGGMELVVPAELDPDERDLLDSTVRAAFEVAGCSGYARVDCFVEPGRVLLNEINTSPGFTRTSVFGRLFEAGGRSYPDLLSTLVETAVERDRELGSHAF